MPEGFTPEELEAMRKALATPVDEGAEKTDPTASHSLMEIWEYTLRGGLEASKERITPAMYRQVINVWPQIRPREITSYYKLYYQILEEYRSDIIAHTKPEHLEEGAGEDDLERFHDDYVALLIDWQKRLCEYEVEWSPESMYPDAYISMAAIADSTNLIFGPQGLTTFLIDRGFTLSEEEQKKLQDSVEEHREEVLANLSKAAE